jgi:hypothetical protein
MAPGPNAALLMRRVGALKLFRIVSRQRDKDRTVFRTH